MAGGPQAGILNRPPEHELLVAMQFEGTRDRSSSVASLEALRALLRRELRSDIDGIVPGVTDKAVPFVETGELGFAPGFDRYHLTVTVGLSINAMDALEVPAGLRPSDLGSPVPWTDLGIAPAQAEPGDVLVQICSDNPYINEHVQRRIEHVLTGSLATLWCVSGSQRFTSRTGRVNTHEARALNGFLDGTANLDPSHNDDDYTLVFVNPDNVGGYPSTPPAGPGQQQQYGQNPPVFPPLRDRPAAEAAWTRDGTYAFVQAVVLDTVDWDTRSLNEQESTIGRFKLSGASLDLTDDSARRDEAPGFATNPQTEGAVAFAAHIRKANPRATLEDLQRRVFRRGYPLMIADGTSAMRRGLIFQSYSRSTSTQIEFILKAWMFNPNFPQPGIGKDRLLAFFQNTLCGGYYFVPPLDHRHDPTSWVLPPSA